MHRSFSAVVWLVALAIVLGTAARLVYQLAFGAAEAIVLPNFDTTRAWNLLSACAAVGLLSMVAVQSYRLLIPVRGRFHRDALAAWMVEGHDTNSTQWKKLGELITALKDFSAHRALREFEEPRLGRTDKSTGELAALVIALYDLPLEQLCGQLSSTADILLEHPRQSPHLMVGLVGQEGMTPLVRLVEAIAELDQVSMPGETEPSVSDVRRSADMSEERDRRLKARRQARMNALEADRREAAIAAATLPVTEARAVLARYIQQRIDAFQIATGSVWRRRLRGMVLVVSIGAAWVITYSGAADRFQITTAISYIFYGTITGVLGAFLAMLFRDLTAIVELARRRS